MITLNLISPEKKQKLRLTQLYTAIKNLIVLVLLFTIIIAIILLLAKMVIQNNFNRIVSETTLITKTSRIFNQDIKIFNQQLIAVEKIQKNYIPWTNFFINFNSLVPDDINIYNLNIEEGTISIFGIAKIRARLLEFKDNLENSDLFSETVVPLENLLTKENIDFSVKADIDPDQLKPDYDN